MAALANGLTAPAEALIGGAADDSAGPVCARSPHLSLAVLPDCSGKIIELRTLRGRNWLWHNRRLPFEVPHYGADFVAQLDSGGWDEVFPSVTPSDLAFMGSVVPIPDHGEFVGLPFVTADVRSDEPALACVQVCHGRAIPVSLRRTLTLSPDDASLSVSIELRNHGQEPVPYLYAVHPLLDAQGGIGIELPHGQPVSVYSATGVAAALAGATGHWPLVGDDERGSLDLSQALSARECASGPPLALKVFVATPSEGRVRLRRSDGSTFTLSVNPAEFPYIGLWINRRGWAGVPGEGYLNLGLEPTTAPTDDLNLALGCGTARSLLPSSAAHFQFSVSLAD